MVNHDSKTTNDEGDDNRPVVPLQGQPAVAGASAKSMVPRGGDG